MDIAACRKAVTPAVLALVAVATQWIVTGAWDVAETRTIAAGAVTALAVFFVPNDAEAERQRPAIKPPT